jgi:hypothetical protein
LAAGSVAKGMEWASISLAMLRQTETGNIGVEEDGW